MVKLCNICHMPIEDWRNDGDTHPDCELKQEIQHAQKITTDDGTGQDEEVMLNVD